MLLEWSYIHWCSTRGVTLIVDCLFACRGAACTHNNSLKAQELVQDTARVLMIPNLLSNDVMPLTKQNTAKNSRI